MSEIHEMSAVDLKSAYHNGTLTRYEVVEALLRRVEEFNPVINSLLITFGERALEEAKYADAADQSDRRKLPLDGVPVIVSDWYAVAGAPSTQGVVAFKDNVAPSDDAVIHRIREAGAIILGKAPIPEAALRWNLVSELYGETLNPRDTTRSAGGSGGAVAASVASGFAPIGFHADAGGSLRLPAAYCEVIAYRTTPGAVIPLVAPATLSLTLEHMTALGTLTRTMDDAWLAVRAVAGEHASVPATSPSRLPDRFDGEFTPTAVAVLTTQTGASVDPDIEQQVQRVAEILRDAGYAIEVAAPPHAERLPEHWLEIVGTEVAHSYLPPLRDVISASAAQHMDELFGKLGDLGNDVGKLLHATQEMRANQRELSEWMSKYKLIVAPVAGTSTPKIDYDYWLDTDQTRDLFNSMRNLVLVNAMGLPAVALPNGVQIIARPHHDEDAVAAASKVLEKLPAVLVASPIEASSA